jgi:hypothetical protein
MSHADSDLRTVDSFLLDILSGKISTEEEAMKQAAPFWGEQGAWYTVGWKMGVTVEQKFGRARLIADECDPAAFLADYNLASGDTAAHFSASLVKGLRP